MERFDKAEASALRRCFWNDGDDPTERRQDDEERAGLTSNRHDNHEDNDDVVDNDEDIQANGRRTFFVLSLFLSFILAFVAVHYLGRGSDIVNLFINSSNANHQNNNPSGFLEVRKQINNEHNDSRLKSSDKDSSKFLQDIQQLKEDFQDFEDNAAEERENDRFYNAKLGKDSELVDGASIEIKTTSEQEENGEFYNAELQNEKHDNGKHNKKNAKDSDNVLSEKGFRGATNANCPRSIPTPQIATTPLKDPSDSDETKKGIYHPGVSMEEDPFEIGYAKDFTWYPQPATGECDVSPPPEDPACSCWNVSASCCERSVHPNHKWGHHLLAEWFGPRKEYSFGGDVFESSANTAGGRRQFRYPPGYFHRPVDYREVFFTRNFYESLVSGYLYHKTGHECWLTGSGRPYRNQTTVDKKTFNDSIVQFPEPFPPSNHRSICQYLVDVTEWEGMRVYAEYVMRWYYYTTINLYKAVQIHEDPIYRKTLFLCFEDLNSVNATIKGNVVKRIVKFFYPGGQHDDISLPKAKEYTGSHGTSHEVTQRKRLNGIARELDEQVFHGVFANLNKMFGNCGENNS